MDDPMMAGLAAGTLGFHHHSSLLSDPGPDPDPDRPISLFNPFQPKPATPSDDAADDDDNSNNDKPAPSSSAAAPRGKKASPWHRMKWTDDVVRLLITLVAYVGDEPESADLPPAKRKSSGGGAALQKKGKWKTVSKLMLEKGCYVSPQQCEDKFNDMNKRYKRLNEILGRGTTCQVVENPALLDSMPNVSAKGKDDVRKILSSKHLFYREMCAYHNGQRIPLPGCQDLNLEGCGAVNVETLKDDDDDDDDDDDNEDDDDENDNDGEFGNLGYESFKAEIEGVLQDPARSKWEKREWLKKQALQLQAERVEIQTKAFELEKRRLKWQRFCSKKDREMEGLRLENEGMMMELRRKEIGLDFRRDRETAMFDGHWLDEEQGRVQ